MNFFSQNSRKTQTEVSQVSPAPFSSRWCFDEKLWLDVTRASEAWRQQKGKQQKLINPVTWFKTTESLLIPTIETHTQGRIWATLEIFGFKVISKRDQNKSQNLCQIEPFFPLRFHFYFLLRIWLWFAFIVLEALDVKIRGEKKLFTRYRCKFSSLARADE